MQEDPRLQEIRDSLDELFLGSQHEVSEKARAIFVTLGIEGFADIYVRNKKYGFAASYKILQDLVKLSFIIYSNLDKLPIQRKVILPKANGSYKFIVTSLTHHMLRGQSDLDFETEDTNTLFLVSTGDDMHAKIAEKIGLKGKISGEGNILGGARIDVDHDKKTLNIHSDSGSYGSCSNQMVERLLQAHQDEGYTVTIGMSHQAEFFGQEEDET